MVEGVEVEERVCMVGVGRDVILEDDLVLTGVCVGVNTERDEVCEDWGIEALAVLVSAVRG